MPPGMSGTAKGREGSQLFVDVLARRGIGASLVRGLIPFVATCDIGGFEGKRRILTVAEELGAAFHIFAEGIAFTPPSKPLSLFGEPYAAEEISNADAP